MTKLSNYILLGLTAVLLVFSTSGDKLLSQCFQDCKMAIQESSFCSTKDSEAEGCCDSSDCCEVDEDIQIWNLTTASDLDFGSTVFVQTQITTIPQKVALEQEKLKTFPRSNAPPPRSLLSSYCIWLI